MAVDGISPALAIRSSVGVELWSSKGLKIPYEPSPQFPRDESKNCRTMVFSSDGRFFAYANGTVVKIVDTENWKEICNLPRPKAFFLKFSPHGNFLVTWEQFTTTKDIPEGAPNFYVYKSENGEELFSTIQKKANDWEPRWSSDETLFAMMVGGESFFYDLSNGDEGFKSSSKKIGGLRNGLLSIGPGNSPPFLAFYTPGAKGAPSMCKIYKYPALQQNQAVACKSFFQADNVEMLWNKRGSGLLLLTSTEVDKTGASYYGKQALHFMSTRGDSCAITLGKEGPIHSVIWNPKGTEFLIVYGYMPAKATLYNLKCDPIFDFGEESRNCGYFNEFGNLLVLAGFGNLQGNVEVWDVNKRSKITNFQAPDSTLLEWSPTGEVFVTATTAPRLRIGNGFKVWHYSGALLHETLWPNGQELLGVSWQKLPEGMCEEKPITKVKIEGIKSSQPEASKQVYQPPNVRLMKEGKLVDNGENQQPIIPGLPPGYSNQKTSSNSNRQRNKQQQRRGSKNPDINSGIPQTEKKAGESQTSNSSNVPVETETDESNQKNDQQRRNSYFRQKRNSRSHSITGDIEKDKKIRNLNKKLQDISKLKSRQKKGEPLEANQVTKIANEGALVEELKALKLSV